MFQLAYFSTASAGRTASDLAPILLASRRNNLRRAITGMLVCNKGNYLQMLEGERNSVTALFDVIQQDRRHTGVTIIFQQPTVLRDFPDWTMGFHDLDSQPPLRGGYSDFLRANLDLGDLQPSGALALFHLLKRHDAPGAAAT